MAGNKPHIADYGAVCAQEQPDQPFIPTNSFRGTILYAGPEISSNMYFNPYCADIYSLGVMFHTCLAGVFPFHASPPVLELSFAQQTLSAEAYDLVSKMLTTSPLARPTIDEILSHPWFRIGQ
jgi:serine/threonine protein kinase